MFLYFFKATFIKTLYSAIFAVLNMCLETSLALDIKTNLLVQGASRHREFQKISTQSYFDMPFFI